MVTKCPVCDLEMKQVSARANPGTLIVLDQCGKCGGIWCDKWELFPVEPEEAKRIEPVDQALLQAPVPLSQKQLYCPRCTDRLQLFHDPLLPGDIQFQRCRRCEGIWLNRGQFSRYKNFQRKTRVERMPDAERLRELAAKAEDTRGWVTTGAQGIFAYPQGDAETEEWKSNTIKGAFRLILQTLLRLVIGF
ncbi:MAG TPA: zf-TFIIB domain-containing protein [Candidatus Binatia bacterium]